MKSASALQRLKESRRASREQQTPSNHQHAAWRSDAANEAYLQELDDAFKQLSTHTEAGSSGQLLSHAGISSPGTLPTAAQDCKIGAARHRSWPDEEGCSHAASPVSPLSAPAGHASIAPGWRTGPVDEAGKGRVAVFIPQHKLFDYFTRTCYYGGVRKGLADLLLIFATGVT